MKQLVKYLVLTSVFLLIAVLCSAFRFAEREGEGFSVSVSDYYLDMAAVFAGTKSKFRQDYLELAPQHYNRPLLPFLAAQVGHYFLYDNYRTAFSLLNILFATLIAVLLYGIAGKALRYRWMPSVLFLIGYPQLSWGYHILPDTVGYATALLAVIYLCHRFQIGGTRKEILPNVLSPIAFFLLQALAFLSLETAWLSVVAIVIFVCVHLGNRKMRQRGLLLLIVAVAAKFPHVIYAMHYNTHGACCYFPQADIFSPGYMFDTISRMTIAFHFAWFGFLFLFERSETDKVPYELKLWFWGAALYVLAGYLFSLPELGGYPIRVTHVLFPVVYYLLARWVESHLRSLLTIIVILYVLFTINALGVVMNSSREPVTVKEVMEIVP